MKKLYIFFSYTINNVGGTQLYLRAKINYLERDNWDIIIFYYQDGLLQIKEFNKFKTYRIIELEYPANYYYNNKRSNILNSILSKIKNDYDKIIIESHTISLASWAEIVSQSINSKHFIYFVDESPHVISSYRDFVGFKLKRRELAGISKDSIKGMFVNYKIESEEYYPYLIAYGAADCILDVNYNLPNHNFDLIIGIVGRLEKEYIKSTINDIILFCEKNEKLKINIIYIGGEQSKNEIKDFIYQQYCRTKNVFLTFTGYIFPMPKKLIEYCDFCISGAGAAWAITKCGVPTLTIDPRDSLCNGILGVTTKQTIFSDIDKLPLLYWLDELMNNKDKYIPDVTKIANNRNFMTHIEAVEKGCMDAKYNVNYLEQRSLKVFIIKLITLIFSVKTIKRMKCFINSFYK